jgi:hypothetical protein
MFGPLIRPLCRLHDPPKLGSERAAPHFSSSVHSEMPIEHTAFARHLRAILRAEGSSLDPCWSTTTCSRYGISAHEIYFPTIFKKQPGILFQVLDYAISVTYAPNLNDPVVITAHDRPAYDSRATNDFALRLAHALSLRLSDIIITRGENEAALPRTAFRDGIKVCEAAPT